MRAIQQARAKVVAELQVITYNEFLPALLGPKAIKAYKGYNASVNPGISNEFSTAAYRVGHTMLGDEPTHSDEPAASRRGASPGSPSLAVERDHAPANQPLPPEPAKQPEPGVPATHHDSQ